METRLNQVVSAFQNDPQSVSEQDRIAESQQFQALVRKKKAFLVPATVFFLVYYFALPVLAGYFKPLIGVMVTDSINFGYLFALSQFVMTWVLDHLYMKKANEFDETASEMRKHMRGGRES